MKVLRSQFFSDIITLSEITILRNNIKFYNLPISYRHSMNFMLINMEAELKKKKKKKNKRGTTGIEAQKKKKKKNKQKIFN